MAEDSITINRQDTYTRTINIKDSSGDLVDASGWTVYFTVRPSPASTSTTDDTNALIAKEIDGDATGIQTLTVSSSDTNIDPGTYVYDFQIKKSDNTITSSEKGSFIIRGDVTRSS